MPEVNTYNRIAIPDEIYFRPLEALDLSVRVFNLITRSGVSTIGQILEMSLEELEHLKLGERSIQEIVRQMHALGLLDSETLDPEDSTEHPLPSTAPPIDPAIPLEQGWEVWSITFAPPMGWNPQVWRQAGEDRGQWSLAYPYGDFPHEPGTIITPCLPRTKLRKALRDHELSQFEIASRLGLSPEEIHAWENGTVDPSPDAISWLCSFFGKKPDDLDLPRKCYVLLSIGTNTLTVREASDEDLEIFTKEELQELPTGDFRSENPSHSGGRRDNRRRAGRGKLRDSVSEAEVTEEAHFCYKVPFAYLPNELREALPRKYQCHSCYVQPFRLSSDAELVEWQPGKVGIPDHYRVALTPTELKKSDIIRVASTQGSPCILQSPNGKTLESADDTELCLHALVEALINPAMAAQEIRVAPGYFLAAPKDFHASPEDFHGKSLQQLMAPGVSFPSALQLPDSAFPKRMSLENGTQIAIPEEVAHTRIEQLPLSEKTLGQLRQARLSTLGALLSQEEETLRSVLDEEHLWEVYVALSAKQALPHYSRPFEAIGIDTDTLTLGKEASTPPCARPAFGYVSADLVTDLGQPAFETVYLQLTGITYDDTKLGRLHLVRVSPFVDCFDGGRGESNTVWLTQGQIDQSMPWDRGFERLDVLEARMQVAAYATDHGATPPDVQPADEEARERDEEQHLIEETYRLVPLKNPEDPRTADKKYEKPLELFISTQDLSDAKAQRKSTTAMLSEVIERYMDHPSAQPLGVRLSRRTLEEIHDWMGEDQAKRKELSPNLRRNPVISPNLIMQKEYYYRLWQVHNQETGEMETQSVPELVGYRVIIGVLTITNVPDKLIVHPRESKPTFTAPDRPIRQIKVPNYVPIGEAMAA